MTKPPFREHAQRELLIRELHARPSEPLKAPLRVSQFASVSAEQSMDADRDHLARLCARLGGSAPPEGAKHHTADFGGLTVKWERHTEFCSYTFFRRAHFADPFADTVIEELPEDWLEGVPGEVLSAVHLAIVQAEVEMPSAEEISLRHFNGNPLIGNVVAGGKALVWADFRLHSDRFTRILIQDKGLDQHHAGRTVQRLVELNTYRALALLALPIAQDVTPKLRAVDEALADISTRMADRSDQTSDAELLGRLSQLSAEIESIAARTSYRFGASRAYYWLVRQRLVDLRLERMGEVLTMDGFLERRMGPAMATCESTHDRQEVLAQRASRVGSLLRARVEVGLEEQNSRLLRSMNERARMQLKLQQTVEGLSVVAISYYAIGLVGYLFKGAETAGASIDVGLATGIAVPFVLLLVWFAVRRLRKGVVREEAE